MYTQHTLVLVKNLRWLTKQKSISFKTLFNNIKLTKQDNEWRTNGLSEPLTSFKGKR